MVLLLLVAAACGSGSDAEGVTPAPQASNGTALPDDEALWDAESIGRSQEQAPFTVALLNSTRLAWGDNRLQFAFFYPDMTMVEDAEITARFYRLGEADSDPTAADFVTELSLVQRTLDYDLGGRTSVIEGASTHLIGNVPALPGDVRTVHHDGEHATVFTVMIEFDRMGWWGAELDIAVNGNTYENLRTRFWVQERTPEPMIGEQVPASRQLTVHDVEDIRDIDTSIPPNPDLHQVTVAEALEAGEPMVVAFLTPAFCQTRFCGPVMEAVMLPAWERYGDEVRFIHIEPFDVLRAREGVLEATEVTLEWALMVEPFIFVVDGHGRVTAKFEGILDLEELTEAIDAMLGQ
jgi:hypothetical protein